jgi:diacylglycerol kinase (ATP)
MRTRPAGLWPGFLDALRHAVAGLHHAIRSQRTFRLQLVCAAIIAALATWLRLSLHDAALLALAMGAVLAAELFNTGVEAIVDLLVEQNRHQLAKIAKDIAAAGVVVSVVGAILAGGLTLGPALLARLGVISPWPARVAWAGALVVLGAAAVGLLRLARRPAVDEPAGTAAADREADRGARRIVS